MIDIAIETIISLKDAAKRFPPGRGGRPTHHSTLCRLIQERKLEGIRMGSHWCTSVEALQRYADRETAIALGNKPVRRPYWSHNEDGE
jgi:excisionase family DNA binding protein